VRDDIADVLRGHVRFRRQRLRQDRPVQLVGNHHFQHRLEPNARPTRTNHRLAPTYVVLRVVTLDVLHATLFEVLEHVDRRRQRGQVVAPFARQQRRMQQPPHVLGLDFRRDEIRPDQYPHEQRQEVVRPQLRRLPRPRQLPGLHLKPRLTPPITPESRYSPN
jgi:hypothetical protein